MKKYLCLLLMVMISILSLNADTKIKSPLKNKDQRVEVVNDKTIIFKNVVKIQIRTNDPNQITYVYDLHHSKLVKVARGSFEVDLPVGSYLIQSDKRITKTIYEVIIE